MEWTVETVTPPAQEPVSLQQAKEHLRLTTPDEDAAVARCIAAARRWAESYAGRAFVRRTLRLRLEKFPRGAIRLPFPPLVNVAAVSYRRADGVEVTIPPTSYEVVTGEPALVVPVAGWPSEPLAPALPVSVTYEAGNGVSEDEAAAVLLLVGSLYEHRENEITEGTPKPILFGAQALLHPRRVAYSGPGE